MLPSLALLSKSEPAPAPSDNMDIPTTSTTPDQLPVHPNGSPRSDLSDAEVGTPSMDPVASTEHGHFPSANSHGVEDSHTPEGSNSTPLTGSAPALEEEEDSYSIRLTPFIDHSSNTPALYVNSIERKAHNDVTIRVGRYTDRRETAPHQGPTPIVFKSKVVSRLHAQLTVKDRQWFIQDVGSSSGTFLNQTRLSPANDVSQPHVLADGDVLQLGVDFRGGTEEIYKCIKVRIELNRSWNKLPNNFKYVLSILLDATATNFFLV